VWHERLLYADAAEKLEEATASAEKQLQSSLGGRLMGGMSRMLGGGARE
jgi:hypothetical protein